MTGIRLGEDDIKKIYLGDDPITKVYVGTDLVFPEPSAFIATVFVRTFAAVTTPSSLIPVGSQAGDLLVCVNRADGNASDLAVFAPTDFTLIRQSISATQQAALVVSYKILTQDDINSNLLVVGMQSNLDIQQMILLSYVAQDSILNPTDVPITGVTINSSASSILGTKPADITIPIGVNLAFNSTVSMGIYGASAAVDPRRFTVNTGGAGGTPSEYIAGTQNSLYVKSYNNNFQDVSAVVGMDDEGTENTLAGISFTAAG